MFAKEKDAAGKSDQRAPAAEAGDDGDEGVGIAQGVEVEEVGDEQRERHENDAGAPMEFVAPPETEFPAEGEREEKQREVDREPSLDGGGVEAVVTEQVFVVERADAVEDGAEDEEPDPAIAAKMDALARAGGGEAEESPERDRDAETFDERGAFAEEKKRAGDGKDRAGGTDRRGEGDGKVFYGKVGAGPKDGDQGGFGEDEEVLRGGERGDVEDRRKRVGRGGVDGHERKPDERAAEIGEEEDDEDGVVADGLLGAELVAAEDEGGKETGDDPGHETDQRAGEAGREANGKAGRF